MNKRVLLLLGCVLALSAHAQESKRELWTWKDANGVTHYSDRPVPGAKRVEVVHQEPPPQPASAPATTGSAPKPAARSGAAAAVAYQSLEIWQPANGESYFGADTTVDVRMRSEPELAPGDRLLLYLDGKLVEGDPTSLEYELSGLDRGVHSLAAVILDRQGNEKIRSEPRVFHIKQPTTIAPRAVGPNLQPKPTPRTTSGSTGPK
jgi:hypothetical protein